ncbi:hypothetical protein MJN76_29930, partial [Salmonella enterica subsp. enterica serovar Anatum]|nr:hypothetical protein [Salmonella enterica subsp. enterica serovar Anatum]
LSENLFLNYGLESLFKDVAIIAGNVNYIIFDIDDYYTVQQYMQANIIREVSKRYLAASQPTRSKETTPVALSFHDLHQLTRAAV